MTIKFNICDLEQKDLYFKLKQIFNIESVEETPIVGIYAIFKKGYCVYVGQSKNIASRLATHISGKYKNADFILIYNVEDLGFNDYFDRSKQSMTNILNNCENFIISQLKPIENIIADFNYKIKSNHAPDFYIQSFNYCIDLRMQEMVGDVIVSNFGNEIVISSDYFDYLYASDRGAKKQKTKVLKVIDSIMFEDTIDSILSKIA